MTQTWAACLIAAAMLLMVAGYMQSEKTIAVVVDGNGLNVRTHQPSVGALLREAGVAVGPADIVTPPLDTSLQNVASIVLRHASPVAVVADGRLSRLLTHAATVAEALAETGVLTAPGDVLLLNDRPVPATALLREQSRGAAAGALERLAYAAVHQPGGSTGGRTDVAGDSSENNDPTTVRITLRRAVPVTLREGSAQITFVTTENTLGDALRRAGVPVYLGDVVTPPLESPVGPGALVTLIRARPVTISGDGKTVRTRTQKATIEEVLAEEGFELANKDYSAPEPVANVVAGMSILVTRVREEIITEAEYIPFNTVWQATSELELDERKIAQTGLDGVFLRRIHVVYEDGVQTKRLLEREWIDREPVTKIIAYGTRVVLREVNTIDGPIQYWRKVRVLATWYNSTHGWFPRNSPYYGMTRTGMWATKGIIAVDPNVIRLHTRMYVPGYGFGAAEDTGGLIVGMRVDLAFDEGDPNSSAPGWITVYLLAPAPPASQITYIMPAYPTEWGR
jgi:uncharacterized protein YabE (DUF348 family)